MKTRLLLLVIFALLVSVPLASAQDATQIRLVFPQITNDEASQAAFEAEVLAPFEEENNVDVVVNWVPNFNALQELLTTDFAAGTPPDVFIIGIGWVEAFASQLRALPLETYDEEYLSDFSEGLLASSSFEDTLYGIPLVLDTRLIVYRRDLFEAAGLDPDQPPTSWEELREMAIQLTQRDEQGNVVVAGFDMPRGGTTLGRRSIRQHWFTLLWQWGGELFSEDLSQCTANSEEGVASLQFYTDLIHQDQVIDVTTDTGIDNTDLISTGQAAMSFVHNNFWVQQVERTEGLAEQIGIVPPFENPEAAQFYGGWILVSAAATDHPAESDALLQYLASPEVSLWVNSNRGGIPARESLRDAEYVQSNPLVAEGVARLDIARGEGGPTSWLEIRALFDPLLEEAVNQTLTPQEALDELCSQADAILATAGG